MENKPRLLFGGVFATHTEWNENGEVVERDEFHTRLYWDLWTSGAMKKLKGARLPVLLTIVQHCDRNAEGFPGVRRLEELLPYNKEAINKAINDLVELGFLERTQKRGKKGKFGNNHYQIRYTLPCTENTDTVKNQKIQGVDPCTENTDTVKTVYGKPVHKEDISFKKEFDDDSSATVSQPWEKDFQYMAFRQQFTDARASDIRKHEKHYSKFLDAKEKVGYGKLCELAETYIKQVKSGEHEHKDRGPQIVWFLDGGWQNDFGLDHKENKSTSKKEKKEQPRRKLKIVDADMAL